MRRSEVIRAIVENSKKITQARQVHQKPNINKKGAILLSGITKLPDLIPVIMEHNEMKLIGIPCISLKEIGQKYQHAKEGLLSSSKYLSQVINPQIHYGMWPQVESQNIPDTFAYILCVEVNSFDSIPEWFIKLTVPSQRCVAVASYEGNFDAAGEVIDKYIREHQLTVSEVGREYTICERYNYDAEGFSRYSLPIVDTSMED